MAKNFLDPETGLLFKSRPKKKLLQTLDRELVEPDYFTDAELWAAKGGIMTFDLEVYNNYFLAAFKDYNSHKVVTFELFPGTNCFDEHKLLWVLHNFCLIGFNSNKFDIPLIWMAMAGCTIDQIHEAVQLIIVNGYQPRDIEEYFNIKMGSINTIDLMEVAPLQGGLKTYGGRLHAKRLQDLPFDPDTTLTAKQAYIVKIYCVNDLDNTELLARKLSPQLSLRAAMSDQYKLDLRSKSDAQIAEAVITSEVKALNGYWAKRPKLAEGTVLRYNVPDYVKFTSPELNNIVAQLSAAEFPLDGAGSPVWPEGLGNLREKGTDSKWHWMFKVKMGSSTYKIAMGGLHSTEKSVSHKADDEIMLIDRDVASYYPRIILNQRLYPTHLTNNFLNTYNSIVTERLAAKKRAGEIKKELQSLRKQLTELTIPATL